MKQQKLTKILDALELWLEDNKKGERADLTDSDLRGLDFSGTTPTRAVLAGATLTNAKLANPIIQIGGIGGNKDYIVYRVADDLVQWSECFQWPRVSLEDFIVLIDEEYPETSTEPDELKYRSEYLAAIEYLKIMRNNYLKE